MVKASARPSVTSLAEKPLAVSLFAQAQDWPLCVICDRPSSPWDRNFCAGHFPHPVLRGDDIPLHEERTPSFVVYEDTQHWRCYGACARGGDVVELARLLMDKGMLK